jgi:hypothetical protein
MMDRQTQTQADIETHGKQTENNRSGTGAVKMTGGKRRTDSELDWTSFEVRESVRELEQIKDGKRALGDWIIAGWAPNRQDSGVLAGRA